MSQVYLMTHSGHRLHTYGRRVDVFHTRLTVSKHPHVRDVDGWKNQLNVNNTRTKMNTALRQAPSVRHGIFFSWRIAVVAHSIASDP